MSEPITDPTEPEVNPTVSRSRRVLIVVAIMAAAITIPTYLVLKGHQGALAELVARELLQLGMVTIMLYMGGSVLERQNVLARLAGRNRPAKDPEPEG